LERKWLSIGFQVSMAVSVGLSGLISPDNLGIKIPSFLDGFKSVGSISSRLI